MASCTAVPATFSPTSLLLFLANAAGLVLSVVSILGLCSDACSETAKYTLLGLDFGLFGIFFFSGLSVCIAFRRFITPFAALCPVMLFSAAGAEAHFIWIQKYVIGAWCPLCLGIAVAVFVGIIVVTIEQCKGLNARGGTMKSYLRRAFIGLIAFAVGLAVSVIGVRQETASAAASIDPYLGKTGSPVTVYFISDWFCPGCHKAEASIEQMYPEVARKARVAFIDYPVHPETNNYTPFNLGFLVHEKKNYIKLRGALSSLAQRTRTPSPEDVKAAVRPLGVTPRHMDYADVMYGMQLNLTIYRGFGIKATPSVVVANAKTKKHRVLEGASAITSRNVMGAIEEIGN